MMKDILIFSKSNKCEPLKTKKNSFNILNDDIQGGLYIKGLIDQISKFKLKQVPTQFRVHTLKQSKVHDLILFGNANGFENYDYEVKPLSQVDLHEVRSRVYSLTTDYKKVLKLVAAYAKANRIPKVKKQQNYTEVIFDYYPLGFRNKPSHRVDTIKLIEPEYEYSNTIISKHEYSKVTIFDYWVKIGYEQFTIYVDACNNEYIVVHGTVYYIKKDRFNSKYLVKG